jgi:hypothetical protein
MGRVQRKDGIVEKWKTEMMGSWMDGMMKF